MNPTSSVDHAKPRGGTSHLPPPLDLAAPEPLPACATESPIKVTVRTRDGTRSPYLTPIHANPHVEFEFKPGKPYGGGSYSGTSSPALATTPVQAALCFPSFAALAGPPEASSPPPREAVAEGNPATPATAPPPPPPPPPPPSEAPTPDPPEAPATTETKDPPDAAKLPPGVVHRGLYGRCRFIPFPAGLSGETAGGKPPPSSPFAGEGGSGAGGGGSGGSPPCALFVGQVRFETTPAELLWMIHRVSGACASHLEWRGAGCYILYCRSEADLALVRGIHKRVLFDVGGVWLARTAEEIDALCEYVALEAPVLSRKAHLPRDSMVVEEHRVDVAGPAGGRHHPMMVAGQHPRVVMPYPTGLLPQGQDLSSVYTSYPSYSSPYPAPYRPFLPQIALPNPTELPPPPPYSS